MAAGPVSAITSPEFDVRVVNTAVEGIALKNVIYHLQVTDPTVFKIVVPGLLGSWRDMAGTVLAPGAETGGLTYDPAYGPRSQATDLDRLDIGDTDTIHFKAHALKGGSATIRAWITADVDLDLLFPKGEDSMKASRTVPVNT
jgi:hypothetical protein